MCALGIVHGGWEEELRCVDSERERTGWHAIYNSWALGIGTVPYPDRFVVIVK